MEEIAALTRLLESIRDLKKTKDDEPSIDERHRRIKFVTAKLQASYKRSLTM